MSVVAVPAAPRFVPSRYQSAIFAFIAEGDGDGIVDAVPGSGKTTTLVRASRLLRPDQRGLFVAFNRHIAAELATRLPEHVMARTIHSLGLAALRRAGYVAKLRPRKYRELSMAYLTAVLGEAATEEARRLCDIVEPLVQMARLTLTEPTDAAALRQMALAYDLEMGDARTWALASASVALILALGRSAVRAPLDVRRAVMAVHAGQTLPMVGAGSGGAIDYSDMIWLPVVEELPSAVPAEWVMVDEAQDLNRCQVELLLRARPVGGRLLFVGDRHQAIYAFAGADARSMESIEGRTGATRLPLSICYRCPRRHVDLAARLYPGIEPAPDAPVGVIEEGLSEAEAVKMARPGDLILCRTTAPLVALCYALIRVGKPARVRGRDIGARLLTVLRQVEKQDGCTITHLPSYLDRYEETMCAELCAQGRDDSALAIVALRDKCATLRAVYESCAPRSMDALREAVKALFGDEGSATIWLSTVHRAKGLETERVFILRPELLPHPRAKTGAQMEQEDNLRYVALTRATQALYVIGGPVPLAERRG